MTHPDRGAYFSYAYVYANSYRRRNRWLNSQLWHIRPSSASDAVPDNDLSYFRSSWSWSSWSCCSTARRGRLIEVSLTPDRYVYTTQRAFPADLARYPAAHNPTLRPFYVLQRPLTKISRSGQYLTLNMTAGN